MKDKKTSLVQIRLTDKEKNKAQIRADLYFKGNLSKWIRYCINNANIKRVKKQGHVHPSHGSAVNVEY